MSIVSIIGPKGGIGKTTLSINSTAALSRALGTKAQKKQVCLVDLDLRLPTITSLLDCHPRKTFYDLFETLANKTHQVDVLRTLYQVVTWFNGFLEGDVDREHEKLERAFFEYKTLNYNLFNHSELAIGDQIHDLFLHRGNIHTISQIKLLKPVLKNLDVKPFRDLVKKTEQNSRPLVEEYINYIEEYGFSIIGGEVPVLGKRGHRKRIHEPEYQLLFLEFLNEVFHKFNHVVLDTPAGGVNHLSSLMNVIEQVIFVFDLSNTIAINGSIDALHSFIDYYEDFQADFQTGRLTGFDKAYVNRLVADQGHPAVSHALKHKKFGIMFNRCQDPDEIPGALKMLRDYLDTLDKYQQYKKRIQVVGMIPNHKIINITNNRGTLFYNMDSDLRGRMDQVADAILSGNSVCPTLADGDREIVQYLTKFKRSPLSSKISRIAGTFT